MSTEIEARVAALEAELRRLSARIEALAAWEQARTPILARHAEPPAPAPALPAEAAVSAEELLAFSDGFHTLEHIPDGTACRWTAASARIALWVDRARPLTVSVEIVSRGRTPDDTPPILEVDGLRLPLLRQGEGRTHRAGPIPPRAGTGPTELVLHAPAPFRPADFGAADFRTLGLQVARVAVAPAEGG
jgi:hypothetical protein